MAAVDMPSAPKALHAGVPEYWDGYYQKSPQQYDWFRKYDQGGKDGGATLKDVFSKHMSPTSRILNVGAGMSMLSDAMWKDGYLNIDNVDISVTAMDTMRERLKGSNMTFRAIDCRNMSDIPDDTYDIVVDKGLLDVLTGSPDDDDIVNVAKEIFRVLKPSGKYLFVSFAPRERRLKHVDYLPWSVFVEEVEKPFKNEYTQYDNDFVYICDKGKPPAPGEVPEKMDL